MKKEDYRIINNFSQKTLNSLSNPYYHVDEGCQFNYSELDEQIKNQLQLDESKQFICPVCHKFGQLKTDVNIYKNELKNEQNQLVVNQSNQQMLRMQKINFAYSIFSQNQDVFQLQMNFNSNLLNSNNLSLNFIEDLNIKRNNDLFEIFRKSTYETKKMPTLIGIINFKLILFYHQLKLKVELDIYENSIRKDCIKLGNHNCEQVKIKQVNLINNFIYLIIQQDNYSQLYRGSLSQIFQQNECKFFIKEMIGYTMFGEARLIQLKEHSIMFGCEGSIIVKDEINNCVQMNEKIKIPQLNQTSQITFVPDSFIMCVDLNQNMEGIGLLQEFILQDDQILLKRQNTFYVPNDIIDFSLFHANCLHLISSNSLSQLKAQFRYILPCRENNVFSQLFNIINHHSYLQVKIIPTTKQQVGLVSCALVGLMFQESQTMFPGVLVLNSNDHKIEIELI